MPFESWMDDFFKGKFTKCDQNGLNAVFIRKDLNKREPQAKQD